jgi:hypothetical protein
MNEALTYLDELNDKRRKHIARLTFIENRTRNKRIRNKVVNKLFVERYIQKEMENIAEMNNKVRKALIRLSK